MTVYYVDAAQANDTGNGLTVATAKKTLNAVEDLPVVAGDLVHVKAGTYRELITCDVSGTAGNPIEYRGDYAGVVFGTGGVVRVTGSDNDQTAARASCITATTKHYRTFTGFVFDTASGVMITLITGCTDWVLTSCVLVSGSSSSVVFSLAGLGQARCTIQNCLFYSNRNATTISFTHSATVDNAAHVIQNCIFLGSLSATCILLTRVGGITVRNNNFITCGTCIGIAVALTVGQVVTVNNCMFQLCSIGMNATVLGEIIEDFNALFGNGTNRINTNTGANSNIFPALFDVRWFFQLAYAGAGPSSPFQVVSPFDLASYSQLVNLAGTSPPATDLRGTAVQGAQREWGALEYDSTLKIFGGIHKSRLRIGQYG